MNLKIEAFVKLYTYLIVWTLLVNSSLSNSSQHPTTIIHNHITGCSAEAKTETGIDLKNNMLSTLAAYDSIKKNIPTCYNILLEHKYKITIGMLFASFAHIQYKIYRIHRILQTPASWSNWKATASAQQLSSVHYDELIPELISDIQKKYILRTRTASNNIALSPFDQFIREVSQELELLEWYITIQKLAKITHTSRFFYFDHKKSFIQEKINRIHVMIDIFISWQTKGLLK